MVVIGDTEGGDKLCGRYLSNNCTSLTRDCDIRTEDSDDPFVKCRLNLHDAMNDLKIDENRTDELHSRSFSKLDNFAFAKNIFDSPMGIYGATPVEPLHLIYGGIADRVFECFEDFLGRDQFKKLDKHASLISGYYNRQNSSSSFRLGSRFHKGLKLKGTMSSREKIDRVFLVYLVLLCPSFKKYLHLKKYWKQGVAFNNEEYDLWVHLFERTVIYCKWVCLHEYPCKLFVGQTRSIAYRCIQNYLSLLRKVGDRRKGNGFKIPKFHLNLHVPFYIIMYGSPNVISTETTERHHIELTKKPARNTQQRDSTIIEQATTRVYEKNILDTFIEKKTYIVETEEAEVEEDKLYAAYDLYLDYEEETCIFKWISEEDDRNCRQSMPLFLLKHIFGKISAQKCSSANKRVSKITGYTSIQYKIDEVTKRIRSHPWFYNDQWYDWITYQWEHDQGGTLPCKVYALLDFSSYEEQTIPQTRVGWDDLNERVGIHMLVHSASTEVEPSIASTIDSKMVKEYKMENGMQMIPFFSEKIEPVFCVQDWDGVVLGGVPSFNMIPNRNNVLALRNVDDWNEIFVNTFKKDPIPDSETYNNTSFRPNEIIRNLKNRQVYNKEKWEWKDILF